MKKMKKIKLHIKSIFFSVAVMLYTYFFLGIMTAWITHGDNSMASLALRSICLLLVVGSGVFAYWSYHVLRPNFDK